MCAFSRTFLHQTFTTTIRHIKMIQAATYSFEEKIASHGYNAYKNTV